MFIRTVDAIPAEARRSPLPHGVLAHGEITGHSHRVDDLQSAALFAGRSAGEIFVEVFGNVARIVHEEHGAIALQPGSYHVWRQREYTPEAIRIVTD